MQKDIPYFKRFEGGWPIHDIIRTYLSNEQTRRRSDMTAELEACSDDTDNSDLEPANAAKSAAEPVSVRKKKQAKAKVRFEPTADEDVEADDEDEAPRRKVRVFFMGT